MWCISCDIFQVLLHCCLMSMPHAWHTLDAYTPRIEHQLKLVCLNVVYIPHAAQQSDANFNSCLFTFSVKGIALELMTFVATSVARLDETTKSAYQPLERDESKSLF